MGEQSTQIAREIESQLAIRFQKIEDSLSQFSLHKDQTGPAQPIDFSFLKETFDEFQKEFGLQSELTKALAYELREKITGLESSFLKESEHIRSRSENEKAGVEEKIADIQQQVSQFESQLNLASKKLKPLLSTKRACKGI